MTRPARHFALVPAAGSGARFGAEMPKQYLPLAGLPVMHHTLKALLGCQRIEKIWVILTPGDPWWPAHSWPELGGRVEPLFCGGASRAESVGNGLAAVGHLVSEDDWVLVHDAARPCVTAQALESLCRDLADDPVGGLLAMPVADTLKRADGKHRVAETVGREGLWQAQTPQMFRYGLLTRVLAGLSSVTDEASAFEAAGYAPRLVRSDMTNLKVTYPADLALAEFILKGRAE